MVIDVEPLETQAARETALDFRLERVRIRIAHMRRDPAVPVRVGAPQIRVHWGRQSRSRLVVPLGFGSAETLQLLEVAAVVADVTQAQGGVSHQLTLNIERPLLHPVVRPVVGIKDRDAPGRYAQTLY